MTRVIFCIAHKGISQIEYWSSWLPEDIEMRVYCPRETILPRRAQRLPFFFATQWASPQLVYVLQEGYRCILKEFPEAAMIYLVSGTDIPVSKTLNHTKSQIAFTRSGNGNHQNRKDKILEIRTKDLKEFGLCKQPSFMSTQWIHLTGNHARLIAEYPLWRMQLLHSKLRHTYQHYAKVMPVADEYWPWTILSQCGVTIDDVDDTICTQQDRARPDDSSPITWTSLDTKTQIFVRYDSGPIFECKSLREILESLPEETLFYRKTAVILTDLESVDFDK